MEKVIILFITCNDFEKIVEENREEYTLVVRAKNTNDTCCLRWMPEL